MVILRFSFMMILLITIMGCSSAPKKCLSLKKNDSFATVIEVLGSPDEIETDGVFETWHYHQNILHSCHITIRFKKNKLNYTFCDDGLRDVCLE